MRARRRRVGPRPGPVPAVSGEDRYRSALERHGVQDVQPLYRKLLVRLRSSDPEAYETAVARYEQSVVPGAEREKKDPVRLWVRYGIWLANRLQPGRVVAVDESGRSEPVVGEPPLGPLLLHLPDEARAPAVPLAVPAHPSRPQSVTVELLCP